MKRFGTLVTTVFVAASLLAGCGGSGSGGGSGAPAPGSTSGGTTPAARGEIRIAMQYDMGNLDPATLTSVTDKQMVTNLFNGLVHYKLGTAEIEKDLAESWETSADGTVWTFHLKKGVKWQKGYGEFKASDVKFTFDRVLDPATKSPGAALIKGLKTEVVDDSTVKFTLLKPDAAFLDKLCGTASLIVPEKAVKEMGAKFAQEPVGTGAYQFDKWNPQQETDYVANDEWFGGKPGLARVVYVPIPDPTTMYNAFEAGDVDLIQVTTPEKLAKYKTDSKVAISSVPGLITRFMGMNSKQKPFDDKRVRQAVLYAINKPYILDNVFKGISTPAKGALAPNVQFADQGGNQYEYNPTKAKELLAQAGLANGFSTQVYLPNIDRFTGPATVIQENLKQVGINVEIKVMETQTFLATLKKPEGFPMYILSRGQEATPDRVLSAWFTKSGIPTDNWANIDIPDVNQWIDEALKSMDSNVRKDRFAKVQQKINDEAYYLFLDHENQIFAASKRVHNFASDPQRSIRLDTVTADK